MTTTTQAAGRVTLNHVAIQRGLERRLVHCWREGRGQRVIDDVVKLHTCADSLKINQIDDRSVGAITPILPDEPEAEADTQARRPLQAVDRLHRFIPE